MDLMTELIKLLAALAVLAKALLDFRPTVSDDCGDDEEEDR